MRCLTLCRRLDGNSLPGSRALRSSGEADLDESCTHRRPRFFARQEDGGTRWQRLSPHHRATQKHSLEGLQREWLRGWFETGLGRACYKGRFDKPSRSRIRWRDWGTRLEEAPKPEPFPSSTWAHPGPRFRDRQKPGIRAATRDGTLQGTWEGNLSNLPAPAQEDRQGKRGKEVLPPLHILGWIHARLIIQIYTHRNRFYLCSLQGWQGGEQGLLLNTRFTNYLAIFLLPGPHNKS